MKTLQIRIPDDLLQKVDDFIKKGFFRSRSHVLREALSKYVSEFKYIGSTPYIVGPFNPSEFELLKKDPKNVLELGNSQIIELQDKLKHIRG